MTGVHVVAALAAITAAACSARSPSAASEHPCCVDLTLHLDGRFTGAERAAIVKGAALWTEGTGGAACVRIVSGDRYQVAVMRARTEADLQALRDRWEGLAGAYHNGVAMLVLRGRPEPEQIVLAAHEIGHALDLDDDHGPAPRVMRDHLADIDGGKLPDADRAAFFAAHGACR